MAEQNPKVEELAAILFINGSPGMDWYRVVDHIKDNWRKMARAAIQWHEPMIAEAALSHLRSAAVDLYDEHKPKIAQDYARRIITAIVEK